jgi:hypothetical protein
VFAHVTPSFDARGQHVGYHSSRRVPYADALPVVKQLYTRLLDEEKRHASKKEGLAASAALLRETLSNAGLGYGQFVFSLSRSTSLQAVAA